MKPQRICVIGTSSCGKSTLAAQISARLGLPHVELDALHWQPGWVEVPEAEFRDQVSAVCAGHAWVIDGNSTFVRDIIWPRTEVIVWLDYSLPVVLSRVIWRTLRRAIFREPCCNGNRESLWRAFSSDSVVLWALRTCSPRRTEFAGLLNSPAAAERGVVILHSPRETCRWLTESSDRW